MKVKITSVFRNTILIITIFYVGYIIYPIIGRLFFGMWLTRSQVLAMMSNNKIIQMFLIMLPYILMGAFYLLWITLSIKKDIRHFYKEVERLGRKPHSSV